MHFYPLATVILMALGTVASPVEKRQLAPPPQGCQDTDLYIRCANINSAICYIPWTTGVCYTACGGCCDPNWEETGAFCNLSGGVKV